MMRIWLIVKGPHLVVSTAPVEGLRLGQGLAGLEPEQRHAPFPRQGLEPLQDTFPDPQTTGSRGDPHALDLAIIRTASQRTASDGLAVQHGHDEKPLRRREVRRSRRNTAGGVAAGLEARGELGEVALQTILRSPAARILDAEADRTREEQPLHDSYGGDESRSLGFGKPTQ